MASLWHQQTMKDRCRHAIVCLWGAHQKQNVLYAFPLLLDRLTFYSVFVSFICQFSYNIFCILGFAPLLLLHCWEWLPSVIFFALFNVTLPDVIDFYVLALFFGRTLLPVHWDRQSRLLAQSFCLSYFVRFPFAVCPSMHLCRKNMDWSEGSP